MVVKAILKGILCLFCISFAAPAFAENEGPTQQLQTSVDAIIAILQDVDLQTEEKAPERQKKILVEVEKRFNFPLMARLALGNEWRHISREQQEKFASLFSALLKNTYIARVEGYSDEKVAYGREVIKGDLAQVSSVFEKGNNRLAVLYKFKKEYGYQWLIYDVVLEGASIVKQYRRQFAQIIKQESFDGLISRLEDKMKAIREQKS